MPQYRFWRVSRHTLLEGILYWYSSPPAPFQIIGCSTYTYSYSCIFASRARNNTSIILLGPSSSRYYFVESGVSTAKRYKTYRADDVFVCNLLVYELERVRIYRYYRIDEGDNFFIANNLIFFFYVASLSQRFIGAFVAVEKKKSVKKGRKKRSENRRKTGCEQRKWDEGTESCRFSHSRR